MDEGHQHPTRPAEPAVTSARPVIDLVAEKAEILRRYRGLLRSIKGQRTAEESRQIRKAFNIAVEAHKDQRRKSGEPYIYHPIAVARICAEEIGLGATSVVAALAARHRGGHRPHAGRCEGPLRSHGGHHHRWAHQDQWHAVQHGQHPGGEFPQGAADLGAGCACDPGEAGRPAAQHAHAGQHGARQAAEDRQRDHLPLRAAWPIAGPLQHQERAGGPFLEVQGTHGVRGDQPEAEEGRGRAETLHQPVHPAHPGIIGSRGFSYEIKGRPKSVHSIYNKMLKKHVTFEEVYDVFAIRIIITSRPELEKADCWKVYSIVTDFYQPSPDRLRDWISLPKANGYESLHTTVMSPGGRWVEVQIRSQRMDEIAEMGLAAHYRYKDGEEPSSALDNWLNRIREMLEDPNSNAIDFVNDFKLDLFSDEIVVFTPKGEMRNLPAGATALDFAFDIHTQVGRQCIGAKVNHKLVPLSQPLRSGDQIEIITSRKQQPKEDWLNLVATAKARHRIKQALRDQKQKLAVVGRESVQRQLRTWGAKVDDNNIKTLVEHLNTASPTDLFYQVARGKHVLADLKAPHVKNGRLVLPKTKPQPDERSLEEVVAEIRGHDHGGLSLGDDLQRIEYKLSPCCNPIAGDDVFGFITMNEGIKIHRVNCPNAVQLMSNFAYRIVKARWKGKDTVEFLAGIRFSGIDDVGLVNKITTIISHEHNVNMRAISFESHDGIFEGKVMAYVHDTDHLNSLMDKLKRVRGVRIVERVDQ
jgi:guanosine-3',5'-bis(diphosphate) 3'-pyrophosphohydrolase